MLREDHNLSLICIYVSSTLHFCLGADLETPEKTSDEYYNSSSSSDEALGVSPRYYPDLLRSRLKETGVP